MANYAILKSTIEDNIKQNGSNAITGPIMQQALFAMINSLGAGFEFAGIATLSTTPGTPDYNVFYLAFETGQYSNFGSTEISDGEIGVFSYNGTWDYSVVKVVEIVNDLITGGVGKALSAEMGKYLGRGYEAMENPEYVYVVVDKDGKILYAIDKNGHHLFFGEVFAPNGFSSPEIKEFSGIFNKKENPEYVDVTTDKDGKITEALRADGTKVFFVPVQFKNGASGIQTESANILSLFKGKKIAWYGTSIPAGSSFDVPIKGNAINAKLSGFANANELRLFTEDDKLPSEYPIIAASLAGADTIYNESVGSSRAIRNTSNPDLLIRCKALGNTVQEICSYIFGAYNIDIANQTFEENTENTIGITTFLTTAGTWSSFVNNVFTILGYSYQICIVARYLCSNSTQWSEYIEDVFGNYLQDVTDMLESNGYSLERLAGYRGSDMFVLEHSVNDPGTLFTGDVESTDLDTFEGAYNLFINTILRYNPSARIAIVANYAPLASEIQYNKIKSTYLKAIADRWHIPFIDMADYSQVVLFKVRTQGYWDAGQVWHDSGFEWTPDVGTDSYTTNCNFPDALSNPSLSQMITNVNPQQVDGVWTWEADDIYLWMWDGLHPHSDKSGRLTILLGKVLSKFLERISVI